MKLKNVLIAVFAASAVASAACRASSPTKTATPANRNETAPVTSRTPGPLPTRGFRAQIVLIDPPAKLRVGQKETINVRVKNASDVFWWARGGETNDRNDNKFYIAVGDRWLDEGGKLLSEMDGRLGISKDLRSGEELELPLQITAPEKPGEYILEVDMVQEQVSWFGDKGSPTARTKVTVVR